MTTASEPEDESTPVDLYDGFVYLTAEVLQECPVVILVFETGSAYGLVVELNDHALTYFVLDDKYVPIQKMVSRWALVYEVVQNDFCREAYEVIQNRDKLERGYKKRAARRKKPKPELIIECDLDET